MLFFLVGYCAYFWSEQVALKNLRVSGSQRLEVYVTSLESVLAKYDYLPKTLELNKDIIRLLNVPGDRALVAEVNHYLEQVNDQAKSTAIYIIDLNGITQASSNWKQKDSFVGADLSFRPYVQDALGRAAGKFYGVGTTSLEAGYFFAHGIYVGGKIIGVAVVKVNIEKLEKTWAQGVDRVLLADENGVIFLTSVPAWKYKTLLPLSPRVVDRLEETRQYFGQRLDQIRFLKERDLGDGASIVDIRDTVNGRYGAGAELLAYSKMLSQPNWQIVYLSDLNQARSGARLAVIFSCVFLGFFLILFLYVRQRYQATTQELKAKEALQNAYDDLEQMVVDRTSELRQTTLNLTQEIGERRNAEKQLQTIQNELVQAGKMAVLGQMSAGITHELNQPLTALRTMSDNATILLGRGRIEEAKVNLATISSLVSRMGTITGQLKVFSRKSATSMMPVSIRSAVKNALFLVERRLQIENVAFEQGIPDEDVFALCESNRLEQVLVNLFNNALDAMLDSNPRCLRVNVTTTENRVFIQVYDSGHGIGEEVRKHLFEPFFTTKAQGKGLGLGLAISARIVRDFGGVLRTENCAGNGTIFTIELSSAQREIEHV